MESQLIQSEGVKIAVLHLKPFEVSIEDTQMALDLAMSVSYQYQTDKLIFPKQVFSESFFQLQSGLAGEILQKYRNYHIQLAIIGDFSIYRSPAFQDFIYESNQGHACFFVSDLQEAIRLLRSTA